MSDLTAKALS